MKKLFNIALALLCSLSMSAALTSRCFITLTSNQGGTDQVKIFENADSYTNDYVNGDDAQKNMNDGNPTNLNIYSIQGTTNVSEVRTNAIVNLPIIIETNDEGTHFTMTFKYVTGTIVLYDAEDPTHPVTLVSDGTYEFDLAAGRRTIANRFYLNYIPVSIKGATAAWWGLGYDADLTLSANGQTASGTIDFAGKEGEWYTFGVELNGAWKGDNAEFTRAANSRVVSGTDNMWFEIENGTVDNVYTFTWTFATNTLTITYPDAAPVYAATVTTNAYGLATFSYDADLQVVESGVKLYKGAISGEYLDLDEVDYVKAAEGVIVYGAANTTYHFNAGTGTSDFSGNELKAASTWAYPHAGYDAYVLSGSSLYLYEGDNMKPNKAFLLLPSSSSAPRRISFRFNQPTAIDNAKAEQKAEKFIGEDGQILIKRGNEVFNLQGQIVK